MSKTTSKSTDCSKNCSSVVVEIVVFEGSETREFSPNFDSSQSPLLVLGEIYNEDDDSGDEEMIETINTQ